MIIILIIIVVDVVVVIVIHVSVTKYNVFDSSVLTSAAPSVLVCSSPCDQQVQMDNTCGNPVNEFQEYLSLFKCSLWRWNITYQL